MAKTCEWWDKKSPINGVAASEILKDKMLANARKLFIGVSAGVVQRIESVDIIKGNNDLDDMTDDEVMAWYLEQWKNPKLAEKPAPTSTELSIMESQAVLFEQNTQILEQLSK